MPALASPPPTPPWPTNTDPGSSAGTSAGSGGDDDAREGLTLLRSQIDHLDHSIMNLLIERSRLSHRAQATRIDAGGTRVELGRERQVRNAWRERLGDDGVHVADAVLVLCRGVL